MLTIKVDEHRFTVDIRYVTSVRYSPSISNSISSAIIAYMRIKLDCYHLYYVRFMFVHLYSYFVSICGKAIASVCVSATCIVCMRQRTMCDV